MVIGIAVVVTVVVVLSAVWMHRWRGQVVAELDRLARRLDDQAGHRPRTIDGAIARLGRIVDQTDLRARSASLDVDRLSASVDVVPFPMLVADADGIIRYRNAAAAAESGATRTGPIFDAAVRDAMVDAAAGRAGDRPLRLFGPPRRLLEIVARPLLVDGDLVGVVGVVIDHSELERVDDIRRDFVANLSHELKTPVGALSLLAETLLEEDDPDVRRRLLDRTHAEAHRMSRIIDDLLELAELEADGELRGRPVRIADVAAEAAEQVAASAERHRSKVILEQVDDVLVHGDHQMLVRAVVNLLENAMKYSADWAEVRIEALADDDHVDLRVRDEGIGIPAKHLDRIFERFYRVDRARSRVSGGTGLGLSIVRHTAERHGGEVLVESREGEGSTFTLRLPVSPPDPIVPGGSIG